jgi:superfamily I DNA/RNA helicase
MMIIHISRAPGSGKTTTIAARIAWLLTNVKCTADQIVLLTFSRNAAREMNHRVRALVGSVSLWAGTFHALANTVLKQFTNDSSNSLFFIDEHLIMSFISGLLLLNDLFALVIDFI